MSLLDDISRAAIGGGVVNLPDREGKRLLASFRGVDFWVPSEDDVIGRQQVVHEFPAGGDDQRLAFAEDIGRVTGKFTIEAFVIGPDSQAARRELEDAINERGPGKLVHPHRGELNVAVNGEVRVRHATAEGGMVRFTIPFIATGDQPSPVVEFNFGDDIEIKSDLVNALVVGGASLMDTSGPSFLGANVLASMNAAVSKIQAVNARISAQLGVVDAMAASVNSFSNAVVTLILTPSTLALSLQNLVNSAFNAITAISTAIEYYNRGDETLNRARIGLAASQLTDLGYFGTAFPAVTGTAASAIKDARNQAITTDLVESAALSEGVRALARLPFESSDQADELHGIIDAIFDRVLERGTVPDDVDAAIRDLRVSFYALMARTTSRISAVAVHTPQVTQPLLVIAHHVHSDARRESEIAIRNAVEYPGFAPGLRPLEVLA